MSVETAAVNVPGVAVPRAADAWRRDRRLLLASQIGRLAIAGTAAWLAFATWLTR